MKKGFIVFILALSSLSKGFVEDTDKLKDMFLQELEYEAKIQKKENLGNYIDNALDVYDKYEEKRDNVKTEINKQKYSEIKEKRDERKKIKDNYRIEIRKIKKESRVLKKNLKKEYAEKIAALEETYEKEKSEVERKSDNYDEIKEKFKRDKFELFSEYRDKLKIIGEEKDNLKTQRKEISKKYALEKKQKDQEMKLIKEVYLIEREKREADLLEEENSVKEELREKYRQDKKFYTEEEIKKDLLSKIAELKKVINNLSPDAITYVTNGTRLSLTQPESKYFFSDEKTPNSYGYAKEIANLINSREGVFLDWTGGNNDKSRIDAAIDFCSRIKDNLEIVSITKNISETEIPINLAGHSHGGNIMIIVANKLIEDGYNVRFLFTFGTPSREYQLAYDIPHVQLYSYKDQYQKIGGWDFDFLWFDLKYQGRPEHKFKNALNINLIFFLDDTLLDFYNTNYVKAHANANYYHQITRYVGTIKKVIEGELFMALHPRNGENMFRGAQRVGAFKRADKTVVISGFGNAPDSGDRKSVV